MDNTNDAVTNGLPEGEGLGDFMQFTSDARGESQGAESDAHGFTRWPSNEPAIRRLSRIGIFRRVAGHGVLRLL